MARTLHHVDLTVGDLALAKRFYKPVMEYLGYRMTEDSAQDLDSRPETTTEPDTVLHPARPQNRDRKHDRYAARIHHLAFRADSRDEVDGLHRVLRQIGATILDPPAVYYPPNYYALFFTDPDGLKLELVFSPGGH